MRWFQLNNFNTNWMFNPPNLFNMGRYSGRNYNQNTSQPSPNNKAETNTAVLENSQHTSTTEPEEYDSSCHGEPGPMGPRGEPRPPGCPGERGETGPSSCSNITTDILCLAASRAA